MCMCVFVCAGLSRGHEVGGAGGAFCHTEARDMSRAFAGQVRCEYAHLDPKTAQTDGARFPENV
jgi:hypothetical protein